MASPKLSIFNCLLSDYNVHCRLELMILNLKALDKLSFRYIVLFTFYYLEFKFRFLVISCLSTDPDPTNYKVRIRIRQILKYGSGSDKFKSTDPDPVNTDL